MTDTVSLLIAPRAFFQTRLTRPVDLTIPAVLVAMAGGLGAGSLNFLLTGLTSNLPQDAQSFVQRLGLVQSLLFLGVYCLMWPLVTAAIAATSIVIWNPRLEFRKLVELTGFAYLPFVVTGAAGFALLAILPIDGLAGNEALDPGTVASAIESSRLLGIIRHLQTAARLWCFLLTSSALAVVLGIRWWRAAVCVLLPFLAYSALLKLAGL